MDSEDEGFTDYRGIDADDSVGVHLDEHVNKEFLKVFDSDNECSVHFKGLFSVVAMRCRQETAPRWQDQAALCFGRDAVVSQALHESYPQGAFYHVEWIWHTRHWIVWRKVCEGGAATSFMVLEFVEAWWNVPFAPREWKLFV